MSNLNKLDIIQDVLLNDKQVYSSFTKEQLSYLRRESITKPIISVGAGTCGMIAGALKTFDAITEYVSDRQIDVSVQKTGCLGLCNLEPLVEVHLPGKNRILLKNITEDKVVSVLDDIFHKIMPEEYVFAQFSSANFSEWIGLPTVESLSFFALQNRQVLKYCGKINPYDINEYIAFGGYRAFVKTVRNYTAEQICDLVDESGLRGRSGGGYFTGKKWKIGHFTQANQKYLICNAEESDPGAYMDRAIVEGDPHRVIEGMAIAAYAIGATKAIIYIRSEYIVAIKTLETAISQAKEFGLLGQDILNSGFNLDISIKKCPGAFVCGEETALISSLEGMRGMPETKPPFPSQQGLFNKPTIVNNVETLANVPAIIQNGPGWFANIGEGGSKGTKIFALSGKVTNTALVEVSMGTSFREVIFNIAGGVKNDKKFKALLLGGPVGHCFTEEELDVHIDFDELRKQNILMGSGGMIILDENNCILDTLKYFMDYMQYQSCGKCIPCREGMKRLHEILTNMTKKPVNQDESTEQERLKGIMLLKDLAEVMKISSLCGLGQSAANPILSALKKFRNDFEEHIFNRKCEAAVCKELRTFYIEVDACTGCSICAKKCPTNAIVGSKRMPYFVMDEQCIGCGICLEVCKFNAVFVK
jgi:NADH:ubiquinone oxidoreductase subunit F (NADH-binding)/(2Fe-2S) ferredoxin/Pyruvate/2-oxoacid:ferredoxin oxidoreductase delta subunit